MGGVESPGLVSVVPAGSFGTDPTVVVVIDFVLIVVVIDLLSVDDCVTVTVPLAETLGDVVVVVVLLLLWGRETDTTDISPRPCNAGGQALLAGLTVTDILGFSNFPGDVDCFEAETDVMDMP